jgi:hypothetical protein
MRAFLFLPSMLVVLFSSWPLGATDPVPPKTLMTKAGKLLLSESLATGLGKGWLLAKGKWEPADDAVRGAELKSDKHQAVARRNLDMKDVVVQYSFKLGATKITCLSFNAAKGHVSRVQLTPTLISVCKDPQDGAKKVEVREILDQREISLKTDEWHTLTVELRGPEILATLDGKITVFGTHPANDKAKASVGFTVKGGPAFFKDLAVWEATEAMDWKETKARLIAEKIKK